MSHGNLFWGLPQRLEAERFDTLLETPAVRIERILSTGQVSLPGEWCEQPRAEWVALLQGAAEVRFEDEPEAHRLTPGDWLFIAAHRLHRVDWTDPEATTVWIAMHWDEQ